MSILIVDDSSDQRLLLGGFLQSAGHEDLVSVESAEAALNYMGLAREESPSGTSDPIPPELILMDILMPGLDGIEACRRIKSREHLRDIPIIMVTVKSDTDDLQEAFTAGAMDFLTKPVQKVELLARVNSALTLKREMDRRKARELDLSQSNQALEKALREVKVLRGFIPICASCKKIRNDQGAWQQLEVYLHEHSEAEFSHGICSACVEKLYPGLYKK